MDRVVARFCPPNVNPHISNRCLPDEPALKSSKERKTASSEKRLPSLNDSTWPAAMTVNRTTINEDSVILFVKSVSSLGFRVAISPVLVLWYARSKTSPS